MKKYFNSPNGFTLIELLIVIAILGILSTAVLSAINPVEQINRGRDTGTQSDAEQLLSAIHRFNAAQGYFPWQTGAGDTAHDATPWTHVNDGDKSPSGWTVQDAPYITGVLGTSGTSVLDVLGGGTSAISGSNELQKSFVTRIKADGYNPLFVYNKGLSGDSTYVCFIAKSGNFQTTARNRCGPSNTGMPDDMTTTEESYVCNASAIPGLKDTAPKYMICLP